LILEDSAKNVGVFDSRNFKRLLRVLFIKDDEPVTGAETEDSWTYKASNLDAIKDIFSERIYSGIDSPTTWVTEKVTRSALGITERVWSKFPRNNSEDAIICLSIKFDIDLIRSLFPMVCTALFPHGAESQESLGGDNEKVLPEHQKSIICK
jgi:hypothetical protein